ncbi:MAG: hypothetical protein L0K86_10625, partial [Actinomycetia bacterium]|nr:hypothetical protein [Actinomycetes bacterium]
LDALGAAVARRIGAVAAAVRRLDGLAPRGPDAEASKPTPGDVRELVLRALRAAGDRDGHRILRAVAGGAVEADALAEVTGLPRLALWEALGDLVQVGLLERDPVRGTLALTGGGAAVLALVERLVAAGEATL